MPPTTLRTDAAGQVQVTGFLGDYWVTAHDLTADVELATAGASTVDAVLRSA
ncbi:MAG: hypothetical protein AVDCRST_MAG36-2638 [uncultured Nocardioidaceae bacterium]|uniref:Uncharacterized protein n=1 Tax=uncultured Nocardioidaceae bacterium TaxID=253824 RepID=A0A6J4MJA6_9ACTN|nr:MAG: hypothetical protein AVDCRST_MAG36-2638 [uncultured Nocardioidaceae bacterium]